MSCVWVVCRHKSQTLLSPTSVIPNNLCVSRFIGRPIVIITLIHNVVLSWLLLRFSHHHQRQDLISMTTIWDCTLFHSCWIKSFKLWNFTEFEQSFKNVVAYWPDSKSCNETVKDFYEICIIIYIVLPYILCTSRLTHLCWDIYGKSW